MKLIEVRSACESLSHAAGGLPNSILVDILDIIIEIATIGSIK